MAVRLDDAAQTGPSEDVWGESCLTNRRALGTCALALVGGVILSQSLIQSGLMNSPPGRRPATAWRRDDVFHKSWVIQATPDRAIPVATTSSHTRPQLPRKGA